MKGFREDNMRGFLSDDNERVVKTQKRIEERVKAEDGPFCRGRKCLTLVDHDLRDKGNFMGFNFFFFFDNY